MKNVVLQPTFYEKFECIGGACRNDCCHGWRIDFTREEFKNVKKRMHTDAFKEIFKDAFILEKGSDKCLIKTDEKGRCKFLADDGLCKMYIEVGPENMSKTCKVFPRHISRYIANYERFLSIACETTVNLCLEEKDGIMLEVQERELTSLEKNSANNYNLNTIKRFPEYYLWDDMKILVLGVLQNRNYTFGERMVILGMAMQKIDTMMKEIKPELDDKEKEKKDKEKTEEQKLEEQKLAQKTEKVIGEIQEYIQLFIREIEEVETFKKPFANLHSDGRQRASQTVIYHMDKFGHNRLEGRIKERIDLVRKFEAEAEADTPKINFVIEYTTEKYNQAMADFDEFLKGREYWLENIMVEGFLASRTAFRVDGGFWRNYCAMAITYSVFLFMLTCCVEKDTSKEDFVYYVTEIARTMFHNEQHTKQLEEHLEKTQSDSLAHIAVLVL